MPMFNTRRLAAAGVALLALAGTLAGCGDLTVQPKSTITSGNIFSDPTSYRAFLAKLYGGLGVTGQAGPNADNTTPPADIAGIDEGFSQYMRAYWQFQEVPTDEAVIGSGDPGLPVINTQLWSASNEWVNAMYSRIFYQVALANQFLRETTDAKLSGRGATAQLKTEVAGYRNEARFLRALSYYHAVDLYGPVPIVDENFDVSKLPTQATRAQVFGFVESELKAVREALPATSTGDYYGRASQAAVDMILAHLYLNAEVWTGTARYADARAAAEAVINSNKFSLDQIFRRIFALDNTQSPEIIFTVPQDGLRTRTWGGLTYLIHAAVGDGMNAGDFGINGGWYGLRIRAQAADRWTVVGPGAPDKRAAIVVTQEHTKDVTNIAPFTNGYGYPKYSNKSTTTGAVGSNSNFPDTDYPMFRLADAYLIYAEAVLRPNGGGSRATALGYINALRDRAYGNTSGRIADSELSLQFILDERSRELMWEGFRRQDLVRFNQFTENGVWQWKGGVREGRVTEKFRDLYPIPSNERSANPNIAQNPGY